MVQLMIMPTDSCAYRLYKEKVMLYHTENQHGGDIYKDKIELDYSINVNPFGTPPNVIRAVKKAAEHIGEYPDPYCRELIRSIAQKEKVPESYILCGNGAAELIYSFCLAIKPGKAAEPAPTFSEYSLAVQQTLSNSINIKNPESRGKPLFGCWSEKSRRLGKEEYASAWDTHGAIARYMLSEDNDFELDEGFIDFVRNIRPEAVFVCNPNNPTGRTIDADILKRLLVCCAGLEAKLFVDECFLELSDNAVSMKGYLAEYPNLFILKAFTKNYAMAGIRLGYCLCSDAVLLRKMSEAVQPWNISVLAQAAGVAAIKDASYIKKAGEVIKTERVWLMEELCKLGYKVCKSEANYILFKAQADLDVKLRQRGIAIRNCNNFEGLTDGWFRIAVKQHEENMKLIETIRLCI